MNNTIRVVFGLVSAFAAFSAHAQQFQWPQEPENLQVLPEGTRGNELGSIMRDFAGALDVRCEHCHVGEGNDLTQFDFAADDKAPKRKARIMVEMVRALNDDHLGKLSHVDEEMEPALQVTCMTCHRRQTRPRMLEDILIDTISTDGVDAGVAKYHALREKYYGGFSFDFSSGALIRMGEQLGKSGDFDSGARFIELEIEMNGESPAAYYSLGGVQVAGGMTADAVQSYTKGMALAPEGWKPFFQAELDKLANAAD